LFIKVSESELSLGLVDRYKEQLRKTREAMQVNFDQADSVFITLKEELERLFKKKKLEEERSPKELENDIQILRRIYDEVTAQNRRDNMLKSKYRGDEKYTRIHKRLLTPPPYPPAWGKRELNINTALLSVKDATDEALLNKRELIHNEAFFTGIIQPIVLSSFQEADIAPDLICAKAIVSLIVNEYISEYKRLVA
jgi:type I restriction enzyme R subunit